MSDGLTRMYDDIDRYLALCEHFGEDPVYRVPGSVEAVLLGGCRPDCHGAHAKELERRYKLEKEEKI